MPITTTCVYRILQALVGNPNIPFFNEANAHIGVGNGTTPFDIAQNDLQGTSKLRKAMASGYPQLGAVPTWIFRSLFGTSDANWHWQEWAVFNYASGGVMMCRKVEDLGTKPDTQSWQLTVSITPTHG